VGAGIVSRLVSVQGTAAKAGAKQWDEAYQAAGEHAMPFGNAVAAALLAALLASICRFRSEAAQSSLRLM
jgi:hypothetical protein